MHNIGDWYRYNPVIDLEKIISDLPEDILFSTKLYCPVAFDCSLNARHSIWIDKIPHRLIVALGMDNANQTPNDFLLTGAFSRMAKLVQPCKNAGVLGISYSIASNWWGLPLLEILNKLSWPDGLKSTQQALAEWSQKYFGKTAAPAVLGFWCAANKSPTGYILHSISSIPATK
ncbi:MAG: hypothetical protein ABIG61_14420 [Planctomycetota bacterium]